MREPRWVVVLVCAMVLQLLFSAGLSAAETKPIELSFSNFFPAPHNNSVLAEEWSKAIAEKSGGKVKITMFHGGTLTPAPQCYDGVTKGLSDIGMSALGYTRGRFPLTEVIDLPLGYKSGAEATKLANAYLQKFQPKEFADSQIMFLHAHGPGLLHTKKPVATLEDFKGMKIGCTGLATKIVEKLGGTPVAGPMPERYDSLQKGVIEGGLFPVESLKGWKLAEVVQSTTLNNSTAYTTAFFVAMNKEKWASLPADVQKVFTEVNAQFANKFGAGWDQIDKEGYDFAASKGLKTIALSKEESARWALAVRPILDEYVANMKAKGLPGEEALKFCTEELAKLQK